MIYPIGLPPNNRKKKTSHNENQLKGVYTCNIHSNSIFQFRFENSRTPHLSEPRLSLLCTRFHYNYLIIASLFLISHRTFESLLAGKSFPILPLIYPTSSPHTISHSAKIRDISATARIATSIPHRLF